MVLRAKKQKKKTKKKTVKTEKERRQEKEWERERLLLLIEDVESKANIRSTAPWESWQPALELAEELHAAASAFGKSEILTKAKKLLRFCQLKRRGITDCTEFGMGLIRGNERLDPTTLLPIREGDETMTTQQKRSRSSAKKKKEKGEGKRPVGETTGLPIQHAWVHIFVQNEKAAKNNRMTDKQISDWLKKEFKGRPSKVFEERSVNGVRSKYNRGGLTKGAVPSVLSRRFDENGEILERKARTKKSTPSTKKGKTKGKSKKVGVKVSAPKRKRGKVTKSTNRK